MSATSIDNRVWGDPRFKALPPALRAAIGPMISRLEQYGDASLTDAELRVDLLGPKRMAHLADALLSWGWLQRAPNGNLARAGLLAPVSADALRMRAHRASQPSEAAPSTKSTMSSSYTQSTPEPSPNTTRTQTEQTANESPAIPRLPASAQNQIRSGSNIYLESDPIRLRPPTEIPKNKAFDKLLVEGVDPRILTKATRRMASQRPPIEPWKERYLRATVKSIIAERQQSLPMVTIVPGTSPPNRASPPVQLPQEKPAFLTRRLANRGSIL